MNFTEQAGAEIIGGIVGGLVVVLALCFWNRVRTFQLRYLNPKEDLTADMREYTALRTETGRYCFRIRLRPRYGIDLVKGNLAFFEKGKLPWLAGRRRNTTDARIYELRCFDHDKQQFRDHNYVRTIDNDGTNVDLPGWSLPGGTCTYLELYAEISNTLKSWEGILSFKIQYQRDGNPEQRSVHTKFFVRANDQNRPLRSIFKRVLTATKIEQAPDKEGSQT